MSPLDATVSISISAPDDGELAQRGLSLDHVRHAYVELARQILAAGGSLAYGGNPIADRPNYVQILIALLRTYSKPDRPAPERIQIYLAAPVWRKLSDDDRADIGVLATINEVAPVGEQDEPLGPHFTAMRQAMTDGTQARIVLGGRLQGRFVGRWPGIVEEAWLALRGGDPLFVVGGLGGAATLVADLIRGTSEAQLADPQELREVFEGADLHNGLTAEENELLFETADLDLIVALILRGLEQLFAA